MNQPTQNKLPWTEKLRQRWGVKSVWQVFIILVVFACTGFTVLFLKKPLLWLLGLDAQTNLWLKNTIYFLAILPLYQIVLLIYGFIFGQFQFFWHFEKQMIKRIGRMFVK
ncbi:MAG: hypothetical protein NZ551_00990 [Microscillaceae bacterium]|nr:hypothetical protein [Microscillaceae bacterium]MDW8459764.1 hypothetical protein [Cytophagales bacterium]